MTGAVEFERIGGVSEGQDKERDRVEASMTLPRLPEDLVEQIIAMLPFPFIFTARCLSKSWLTKFSAISSRPEDELQNCPARAFQKQVAKWSSSWRTFCPVFLNDSMACTFYDRVSGKWLKMPSFSYLPKDRCAATFIDPTCMQMEGPLLYGFARNPTRGWAIYVVNILTHCWRELPIHQTESEHDFLCLQLVIDTDLETYKVILVCQNGFLSNAPNPNFSRLYVHIYESSSNAWKTNIFPISCNFVNSVSIPLPAHAYANGILYIAKVDNPVEVIAYHTVEENLEEITITNIHTDLLERMESASEDYHVNLAASLVVCKGRLLLFVIDERLNDERPDDQFFYMWEIDLCFRKVSLVTFQEMVYWTDDVSGTNVFFNPVSDTDCVFFLGLKYERLGDENSDNSGDDHISGGPLMEYDVMKDKFTALSTVPDSIDHEREGWIPSSFQPGLSPFMPV